MENPLDFIEQSNCWPHLWGRAGGGHGGGWPFKRPLLEFHSEFKKKKTKHILPNLEALLVTTGPGTGDQTKTKPEPPGPAHCLLLAKEHIGFHSKKG